MGLRVAIVGSRDFLDRSLVEQFVIRLAARAPDTVIISGAARGVDTWAAQTAKNLGLEVIEFPVTSEDWERYGNGAGRRRNTFIVEACDVVVAFWNGVSGGTMDTVRKARAAGKKVKVIEVRR